jgi:hypothetical protein
MLEDYYVKPSTVDRVRASWLAPQIESYLEWLESHRYSRLVVYRRLPLLFHFAEFAQKKGCKDAITMPPMGGPTGKPSGPISERGRYSAGSKPPINPFVS